MRVLTVLDSWQGKVSCYDVEGLVNEYEDFIESKGHILNHCQWLVTNTPSATALTELERDILRFALDYTYGYLTDIKEYPEKVEEQIEALKTLTQKLLS